VVIETLICCVKEMHGLTG